jgi:diguanylate cyclase (GGDEF)-like protein
MIVSDLPLATPGAAIPDAPRASTHGPGPGQPDTAQPPLPIGSPGIRLKLMLAFGLVVAAIILFVLVAVGRLYASIEHAARLEATHLAHSVAESAREIGLENGARLQEYVKRLAEGSKRDFVIVGLDKRGLADADPAELGHLFDHDPENEVGLTMRDGMVRTFVERNERHPEGAHQIVVPLRTLVRGDRVNSGAVILEYTQIREELLAGARGELILIFAAGAILIVTIILIGRGLSRQITVPLERLHGAVQRLNGQDYAAQVPVESGDELGALGHAFNRMARALHAHRAQLENRVAAATSELRDVNAALAAEAKKSEAQARHNEYLALHDSLTALPNRSQFARLLGAALGAARACNGQFAVLFIDLDRFKNINDTLGHAIGDEMLAQIALRLRAALGESGVLARFGGDEFVVLLPCVDGKAQAEESAGRLLEAAARPFNMQGKEFRVTASIGCALYPRDGLDERSLLKNADIAMYQAKEEGKNNLAFYSARLNSHSLERLALESDLRQALARGELEVHYQPKVEAASGRIQGMEALLRWRHPDWGMIPPVKFIPLAEETGLIGPIGKWVLETACQQTAQWIAAGAPPLCIAVNLSARQFADESLLDDVVEALYQSGLPAHLLELEITESLVMRDLPKAVKMLNALKRMGVRLAIDDFGTGYSSLANLKKFPLDTIKIDRSFVRDLPGCDQDCSITRAIISMSEALGLEVVAEGVETEAQAAFLRSHGCGQFQGYLFSKPLGAGDFERYLEDAHGEPLRLAA